MKRRLLSNLLLLVTILATGTVPALAAPDVQRDDPPIPDIDAYIEAIERTAGMVADEGAIRLAAEHGLDLINVAWEDTGRFYGSSVGPNISDVTIQVQYPERSGDGFQLALMPVIRYPNFSDVTADLPIDDFYLLVGNQDGGPLERVTLRDYLLHFRRYLSEADSWGGVRSSLLADRDTHVLVSAQAAFLPIPAEGLAHFNPVIFNYQSYQGDPAVLTIVATRQGTSATIIDNVRDVFPAGYSWGQRLFFNQDGQRASLTGQRQSEFDDGQGRGGDGGPSAEAASQQGLNMVLIIQVPLRQKEPMRFGWPLEEADAFMGPMAAAEGQRSDVENAVIGHGELEGPFTEIDGLRIERDPDFPVRVTVQFYKATSNGIVTEADMVDIAEQIERVYDDADYVGSLVVDGPSDRPTEHDGPKIEPPGWWDAFWQRYEDNVEMTREEALQMLRRLGMVAWRLVVER